MNFNIFKWALLFVIVFAGCEKTDDLILEEPSHQVIFTSEMDFENKIQVEGEISFADISAGVESRMWTFPQGVVDIIGSDNDQTSEEATVKTIFTEVGEYEVHLRQTFKENAYVGTTQMGRELDTILVVTVLDPVSAIIKANYINEDGTTGDALSISDKAENEVTASKSVRFTYSVEGEPENFVWEFEGGDPAEFEGAQEEIDVKYKKIGVYDLNFVASRSRPFGGDTISLKNFIKVVPSTDPVDLEKITDKEGTIALVFSREMDPTTLNPGNFYVQIENGGNVINPAVAKVQLDAAEGNVVLLTLDNEAIYNNDVIKVSYTPGTLSTADGVKATAFTDEVLAFNKVNILEELATYDHSFENATPDNLPYLWWGGQWGEYDLDVSEVQAHSGAKSAYIEFRPNGGMIIGHRDNNGTPLTFPVEKGKNYELGVWIYLEDLGAPDPAAGEIPNVRFYWDPNTNWGVGDNPGFSADFPVGEWVYSSIYVQFGESGEKTFWIRGNNPANPERLKFYMDDLTLAEVELRP